MSDNSLIPLFSFVGPVIPALNGDDGNAHHDEVRRIAASTSFRRSVIFATDLRFATNS